MRRATISTATSPPARARNPNESPAPPWGNLSSLFAVSVIVCVVVTLDEAEAPAPPVGAEVAWVDAPPLGALVA